MSTIADATEENMKAAVLRGDLRRLKSLASSFPNSLEALRYGNHAHDNLVDIALAKGHADVAVYLIVKHGFEVSPEYEEKFKKGGEYRVYGCNEYFQTLEALANLALGSPADRQKNLACYELRNWAYNTENRPLAVDSASTSVPENGALNPEFVRLAASGDLAKFSEQKHADERFEMIGGGESVHPTKMLESLFKHREAIQQQASAFMAKQPNSAEKSESVHSR